MTATTRFESLHPIRLALGLGALLASACGGAGDRPPDVVLIVVDTLRADALGIYGAAPDPAPFLADLAGSGTVFEAAGSTSSWTAPATSSLLTGLYPGGHGVTEGFFAQANMQDTDVLELVQLPEDVPTLAERFQEAGYRTLGLASNVNIGPEMGFERGFDLFERHDGRAVRKLLQRLEEWDVRLGEDQPVFVYLHLNDPHFPYDGRPRFYRAPAPSAEPLTPLQEEARDRWALYQSEVGLVDDALRERLLAMGLGPETLVAFTSDHGEEFQEHGNWYHLFSLYGELTRIPLFLYGPQLGIAAQRISRPVSSVDLAPTLAQLCNLPVVDDRDGLSLAPLLGETWAGSPISEGRPLFAHRFEPGTQQEKWSVRRGRWKLIEGPKGAELYDLQADPGETSNLTESQPERVQELAELLEDHRAQPGRSGARREVNLNGSLLERLETLGYAK